MDLQTAKLEHSLYINSKVDEFEKLVLSSKDRHYTISTCDTFRWDGKLHRAMQEISQQLRSRGYQVSVVTNWGVSDWCIYI